MVLLIRCPVFSRERIVAVFFALDFGDGEDGLEGLADTYYGDELDEGFTEAPNESLTGKRLLAVGAAGEVEVELVCEERLGAADETGEREEVPSVWA
jgi:hypothetical protein